MMILLICVVLLHVTTLNEGISMHDAFQRIVHLHSMNKKIYTYRVYEQSVNHVSLRKDRPKYYSKSPTIQDAF